MSVSVAMAFDPYRDTGSRIRKGRRDNRLTILSARYQNARGCRRRLDWLPSAFALCHLPLLGRRLHGRNVCNGIYPVNYILDEFPARRYIRAMEFAKWVAGSGMTKSEIARRLKVSKQFIGDLTLRHGRPSLPLALTIRDFTRGKVKLDDWPTFNGHRP